MHISRVFFFLTSIEAHFKHASSKFYFAFSLANYLRRRAAIGDHMHFEVRERQRKKFAPPPPRLSYHVAL